MSNAGDEKIIKEEIADLLRTLVSVPGVTGFEDSIRQKIISLLPPTGARISTDNPGNLYATVPGADTGRDGHLRVMVCAHMDEVGFVVNNIDDRGFIFLYPLGGIPEYLGPGEWVTLHTDKGDIQGCVGIHPPHLAVPARREIFADVGARNREQVQQMGVITGTPVTFTRHFQQLGNDRVMGRCLDNRMGCAVLVALLRRLAANNIEATVTGVFSTTEEHGMLPVSGPARVYGARGAGVAAMNLRPDFAVVLDSIVCSDIPGIPPHLRQVRLGAGVALRLVDDLAIMRPKMRAFLKEVASAAGIVLQEGISRSYTDASVIQLADVPVATLGIPLRYAHSPGQIADLNDIVQTLHFTTAIVQKVNLYK
ncbi:M42 family metallopeptidase [Desulfoscipio geothermicus]|uniref:Endoglucanase n=1 Tax=Desulfoscipio geothermicus DSM 3669 TaxID=1121426 RepID=A0A1I6DJH1_9FIRM|nr:M42 family peptidase [Desulfoscipio geothermicus]SFR05613.1 endoglucanase [Desulfoscipio geothermicus DSM 3669]